MNLKQKKILSKLVEKNGQRYSELQKGFEPGDRFSYHIKHLVESTYLSKRDNKYFLTKKGLEISSTFDLTTFKPFYAVGAFVHLLCKCDDSYFVRINNRPNEEQYMCLPGTRLRFNENLDKSIERLCLREFGIKLSTIFLATHRRKHKLKKDSILFDNISLIFLADTSSVIIERMELRDSIHLLDIKKIEEYKIRWPDIDKCILKDKIASFEEYEFSSNYILNEEDL